MTEYRYEARDLRTGTLLGDLPLGRVQWSQTLQRQGVRGTLRGRINLMQRAAPRKVVVEVGDMFVESPPGSGLYEYLGDPGDFVESPPGSGLYEWVGS